MPTERSDVLPQPGRRSRGCPRATRLCGCVRPHGPAEGCASPWWTATPTSSTYRRRGRLGRAADGRQRTPPFRLERVLERAVPRRAWPSRGARATLSARSGYSLVDDLRPRHQARPSQSGGNAHDRGQRACGQGRILAPAHGALRAGRHLHVGAGWARRRRRSRRRRADRPRHVRGHRTMGTGPGSAILGLRRLVAPEVRHRAHVGVGAALDDREGAQSRRPARTQVRTPRELLEHVRAEADPARRPR